MSREKSVLGGVPERPGAAAEEAQVAIVSLPTTPASLHWDAVLMASRPLTDRSLAGCGTLFDSLRT